MNYRDFYNMSTDSIEESIRGLVGVHLRSKGFQGGSWGDLSAKVCQDPTIANVVRVFHPTWNADQFWT